MPIRLRTSHKMLLQKIYLIYVLEKKVNIGSLCMTKFFEKIYQRFITGRGVICTCSYEAREYFLHTAMPISQTYKLFPNSCLFTCEHGAL